MKQKVRPFLMFEGNAEAAMTLYVSLFPDGAITDVRRYGAGEAGAEGSIMLAAFTLAGQTVMCTDSPVRHAFTFTPSFSFFVTCDSEEELRRLAGILSEDGAVMMEIADYGFSRCSPGSAIATGSRGSSTWRRDRAWSAERSD